MSTPKAKETPTQTPSELEIYNLRDWGIDRMPLMVRADKHNETVSRLERELAEAKAGEKWVASKLAEIMAVAVSGFADAVICSDGPFNADTTLSTVRKLRDHALSFTEQNAALQARVERLEKAMQESVAALESESFLDPENILVCLASALAENRWSDCEELDRLRELRRRLHNIGTGAEETPNDHEALLICVRLIEKSYSKQSTGPVNAALAETPAPKSDVSPSRELAPCDHDEWPPTHCIYNRAFLSSDDKWRIVEKINEAPKSEGGECQVPPAGWRCTRERGHSGPCAAVEVYND